MQTVLSIAGFDPSGGAGVLADIKTFAAFGSFGIAVITSLTAQNTQGVYGAYEQTAEIVRAQLAPLIADFQIAAVKIGMLPTHAIVETIAEMIEQHRLPNVVIDPVLCSSSGYELINEAALEALRNRLLPLARVVTPNLAEAARLADMDVNDLQSMQRAARRIHTLCRAQANNSSAPGAVLVKGGHLADEATDILDDGSEVQIFRAPKLNTSHTHGTGCTLSSAIAALLARGVTVPEAVARAKEYLNAALHSAPELGHGSGPLNHLLSAGW
jgi:hydroxymethylpyrimidine/phosphomethylpyrimidine kinase